MSSEMICRAAGEVRQDGLGECAGRRRSASIAAARSPHEAGSRFDEAGVLTDVSKILGHTNLNNTTTRYLNIHRRDCMTPCRSWKSTSRLLRSRCTPAMRMIKRTRPTGTSLPS